MNLCRDCKHCDSTDAVSMFWRCTKDGNGTNPVDGKPEFTYCKAERGYPKGCGPEGRFFIAIQKEAA